VDEGCIVLFPISGKEVSASDKVISQQLEDAVMYIQEIGCKKLKTDEVIQLLEKKNICFDYPNLSKGQIESVVNWLRERDISMRVIALILDWKRIQNEAVELESTKRSLQRRFPNAQDPID